MGELRLRERVDPVFSPFGSGQIMLEEEGENPVSLDRERLRSSCVFMNHSGAWGTQEFTGCASRLGGVLARLMYMQSIASPGQPKKVFCDASESSPLRLAAVAACKVMERTLVSDPGEAQAVVLHVEPLEESEALVSRMDKLIQACAEDCVLYILCGDAEILPAPKDEAEYTQRGLSALQVGMAVSDALGPRDYGSGPLVVCEFPRDQMNGVRRPETHMSSYQLKSLCGGERCMQVTESWKMYGRLGGALLSFYDGFYDDKAFEEEHAFWSSALADVNACGRCGQQRAPLRCSRCRRAHYCDRSCQRAAWKKHKLECIPKLDPAE